MGFLDSFLGGYNNKKAESDEIKQELDTLKRNIKNLQFEKEDLQKKNITLIDKTHAFMQKLKILVGTLEDEYVLQRCWELLEVGLGVKKGAIYKKTSEGWFAEHAVGFKEETLPVIPENEESIPTYAANHGVILSLAHVKKQDDLAFLERRGAIPDVKIACPVRIQGKIQKLILICNYAGNVFSNEDDLDIVQMVGTILGLVLTNTTILAEQKAELDKKRLEVQRLRRLFSKMVSPEIIQYIENNPEGITLGGNRQEIAIFFADIREFTSLSEKESPEKIIFLLNRFFTLITEVSMQYRGTLDKFMGDAAMVLFGTPVPLENPVLSAVRAAIKLQQELKRLMPQWVAEGYPSYGVGIGINFQDVVVGNVGSERLSNFTAIGDGVNLASRLCAIAKAGEIIISQSCKEKLEQIPINFEARHGVSIKGKSEPISIYIVKEEGNFDKCPKCQASLSVQARFCGKCGFRR